jgi:hypothetical protein
VAAAGPVAPAAAGGARASIGLTGLPSGVRQIDADFSPYPDAATAITIWMLTRTAG